MHNDLGEGDAFDANGNRYRAYMDQYQWKCGLALHDWRYVVRIANIDTAALTKNAATGADIIDLMTQATEPVRRNAGLLWQPNHRLLPASSDRKQGSLRHPELRRSWWPSCNAVQWHPLPPH